MANLSDWSKDLMPHIEGIPEPALVEAVREACQEFCEKTLLWTENLDRINVAADTQSYHLTLPTSVEGELISVDDVKYKQDGEKDDQFRTLDPISENQQDLHYSGSWKFGTSPTPSNYWVNEDDPEILYLKNTPTEASTQGLLVRVNVKPDDNCTTVPDFFYNKYRKAIAYGALAKLLGQKAMPWYDPTLASVYDVLFRSKCNDAKLKKTTGATKRPLRVRLRKGIGL